MTTANPRKKVEDRPAVRRQQVMDAARRLFLAHGFHATGIAQIAKDAGVHVVQIYRDFGSKEAVIAAIAEEEVRGSMEAAALAAQGASGARGFRQWLLANLEHQFVSDDADLFLEILAEASRNPRIAAVLREIDASNRKALVEAFSRYAPVSVDEAELEVQAELFITLSSGLHALAVGHPKLDRSRLIAKIEAILVSEIFAPNIASNCTI